MDKTASYSYLEALANSAPPKTKKEIWFRVTEKTPSMLGSGYAGNEIAVTPQPEYLPGDDVTFKNAKGGHTTHRVTHVKPGFVFTKGTFNQNGDGWIPIGDVVGKVVRIERKSS